MALWPFRKRRKKTTEGKNVVAMDPQIERKLSISRNNSRRSSRRNVSRRSLNNDCEISHVSLNVHASDFPLPPAGQQDLPASMTREFHPQKQPHHNGFSSYFTEQGHVMSESSSSLQRPHKAPSIFRKSSKRRTDKDLPSLYNATVSRQNSKKKWNRPLPGRENERPGSNMSAVPRHSFNSIESQSSGRAYKVRGFGVFAPRPTLRYENGSSPTSMQSGNFSGPGLVPSRSNSRRTTSRATHDQDWRYKGALISEENLVGHSGRVDDLVDELDTHGLRAVMERDQRRRDKKKREEEARAQRRLERRAHQQRREEEEAGERVYDNNKQDTRDHDMPDYEAGESSGIQDESNFRFTVPDNYLPPSTMGTQTPLSWFNDNPSSENVNKELPHFSPRPDVVTPVSMDSREYPNRHDEDKENYNVPRDNARIQEEATAVDTRVKTSAWTSFIKRATAARIKKEHQSRTIKAGDSTLISDSEGEEDPVKIERSKQYLEVADLRHREGRTPGRHVPYEVSLAMTAVATGHIQDKEYEDELRDRVLTTPSLAPYHHPNVSQTSTRSSLDHHKRAYSRTDDPTESPIIPTHIGRTSSQQSYPPRPTVQRYSPSLHRYSSGTVSPENKPRSIMSTSLASIDSEGSWLSGKMNPRQSMQQISPLRTSASSLRKQYQELDDQASVHEDDYFSGVERKTSKGFSADEEVGGARLDLDDTDDDDGSINSENETKMWRGAVEKKVVVEEPPRHMRAMSREGMLNDFDDVEQAFEATTAIKTADTPGDRSTSPTFGSSDFDTPLEHPFAQSTSPEFQTPMEHPSNQTGWMEVGGR
ncbi:hypothetical protein EDC01DRAFT_629503 [Geopyxis carbonaria]|nr:hypothetical protein EDC01DRAFT_629503 [Geopyxis carbonaria]